MGIRIVNIFDLALGQSDDLVDVVGADARGKGLHSNGHLGADVLYVQPDAAFPVHTHPGDHLLLCLAGVGSIAIDHVIYTVKPGDLYMVPGMVPHSVGAGSTGHVLVAIGAPHKSIDARDRMTATDWDGTEVDVPVFADGRVPSEADLERVADTLASMRRKSA